MKGRNKKGKNSNPCAPLPSFQVGVSVRFMEKKKTKKKKKRRGKRNKENERKGDVHGP